MASKTVNDGGAPSCPFCGFSDREVVVSEDSIAFAAIDLRPINRYHVLVIPKTHYELFTDLPDEVAAHVFLLAKRISAAVRDVCQPDGITHISDDDIAWGGLSLPHYKLHVIPRFKNDATRIEFDRPPEPVLHVRAEYARAIRDRL
jgi:histidine triad (HIT) family protein